MNICTATNARTNLYHLIDQVSQTHKPVHITSKRANAVLLSEEDWNALQETLYLVSVPGMHKSIKAGMKTPIEKCDKDVDW
jgi:antitoxin YefM